MRLQKGVYTMDFANLVVKMLSGGVTGYLTNDLAVKMLFRKYGPFGGVIIKTRKEFIKNTSALVERSVINSDTIKVELEKEGFREVFENIVNDILTKYLYSNTANEMVGNLPGVSNSFENFVGFYNEYRDEAIARVLNELLPKIALEDILSEKQIDFVVKRFLDLSIEFLKNGQIIEESIHGLHAENQGRAISEFISPAIFKQIVDNLKLSTRDFHTHLEANFKGEIDQVLERIYSQLKITDILRNFEESIKSRTLAEVLGQENTSKISNELMQRFAALLKTAEGEALLTNLLTDVLLMLKKIDSPILALLAGDMRANLEQYMVVKLPEAVMQIISWINRNRGEIENLIEDAIEETLGSESKGFLNIKAKIKRGLYELFLKGKVASKFKVVAKIVQGIEEQADVHVLSSQIAGEIIEYIRTNSVGEIVSLLEAKKIIQVPQLVKFAQDNMDSFIERIDLSSVDHFFAVRLGDLVELDLTSYFEKNIKDVLLTRLENEFLFTTRLTALLHTEVANRLLEVCNCKIAQLITSEQVEQHLHGLKASVVNILEQNKPEITESLCAALKAALANKNLSELLDEKICQNISMTISDSTMRYLREEINRFKSLGIYELYHRINQIDRLPKSLNDLTVNLVLDNLNTIIDGRIEGVVSDNLSRLEDQEIQSMVEEFMGKELKPITVFGALLGVLSAVILYIIQANLQIGDAVGVPVSIFTFGFVGYITNVIALKMIFRPYQKWRLWGIPIPFTPGLIAKEKARFAGALGKFIDENLLNRASVDEIFKSKRIEVAGNFQRSISADNYRMVEEFLVRYQPSLARTAYRSIRQYFTRNKQSVADKLTEETKNFNFARLDLGGVERGAKVRIEQILVNSSDTIEGTLHKFLDSHKPLGQAMPDFIKQALYAELDQVIKAKLDEVVAFLSDERKFAEVITGLTPQFEGIIQQNLQQMLSKEQQAALKLKIWEYISANLKLPEVQQKLTRFAEEKLVKELNPTNRLDEVFNGMFIKALNDNSGKIVDFLLVKGVDFLKNDREMLKRIVIGTAKEEGGLLFTLAQFLDIEGTIRGIIDNMIDQKVPRFFAYKRSELESIADSFIGKMRGSRVGDIGINLNQKAMSEIIANLPNNSAVNHSLKLLTDSVLDSIFKVNLKALLKIISIENIVDVARVFEPEIQIFKTRFANNLQERKRMIYLEGSELLRKIIDVNVFSLEMRQLTGGIEREQLRRSVQQIIGTIQHSPAFEVNLSRYLQDMSNELKYGGLSRFIEVSYFNHDLTILLDKLLTDEQLKSFVPQIEWMLGITIPRLNDIVDVGTKDYALGILLDSTLDSVEAHFLTLINCVNFKEVTERQVTQMDPREIEILFYSFAGRYFRTLEAYGWWGSIFGLTELLRLMK